MINSIIKFVYIFFLVFVLGCSQKEEKQELREPELTEVEAYSLMNDYFLKDLKKRDSFLLFNVMQLRNPDSMLIAETEEFDDDSIPMTRNLYLENWPIYSKNNWDVDRLTSVTCIDREEYMVYFEDRFAGDKMWDSIYGFHKMHNVSYPLYNAKTNIAVIKDFPYRPIINGCMNFFQLYFYKKTKDGWEFLEKKY